MSRALTLPGGAELSLDTLLGDFQRHLNAFARHREIVDKAHGELKRFDVAAVAQVIATHAERANVALMELLELLPLVEHALAEVRAERTALAHRRLDLEYRLDQLALEEQIGAIDDADRAEIADTIGGLIGQLDDTLAATDAELAQIRRVLDQWYDVGADSAITT